MVIDESALMTIPGTAPEDREWPARQKPFADKAFQPGTSGDILPHYKEAHHG